MSVQIGYTMKAACPGPLTSAENINLRETKHAKKKVKKNRYIHSNR